MNSALNDIGIIMMSEARYLLTDIAKRLRKYHGSRIHAYVNTPQEAAYYSSINKDGLFDSINDSGILMRAALDPVADYVAEEAKARRYEKLLGEYYNNIAVANGHLGRGYVLGGYHYPRSRVMNQTDYGKFLHAYNETFDYWQQEISEKKLSLIINGNKEISCIARANGVLYRSYASARYKNYHYWTPDEYWSHPHLERIFHEVGPGAESAEIDAPYLSEGAQRRRFMQKARPLTILRRLGYITLQNIYWRVRGYEKAKGYYFRDRLRHEIRRAVWVRRLNRAGFAKLADVKGPFVFFPMHTEPEASLGRFSPEYFSQLTAIASLSRDLPAGVRLVVKETIYSIGCRPDNFYDQIADLKNVVMMDVWERGVDVVRAASAVATITGTAGLEGAAMGKPIVTFGQHNIYDFLPHVFVNGRDGTLRELLHRALYEVPKAKARADGAQFLQAIEKSSFDFGKYNYVDLESYDADVVVRASDALIASVANEAPRAVAAS